MPGSTGETPAGHTGSQQRVRPVADWKPMFRLIPVDLAAFVLFFQPGVQRFEVLGDGAGGDVFAGGFLQNL